jgi:dihydroflavonol-4-reductase
MSGRKVAVTGGGGFIGRHLAVALLREGDSVRVLDMRSRPEGLDAGIDYRQGSILDEASCRQLFEGSDEVYHLAGLAHLWDRNVARFEEANVAGTKTVLAAARACGVRRIVVTSTETILRGWQDRTARIEGNEPVPDLAQLAGPYTRSKARAHALALEAADRGMDIRIVYPTVPVGAGDDALTSPTVMIRDFLRAPPPAYLDCRLNLVDVADVARGHILAARGGVPGGRYLLGGEDLWMREILALLETLSGQPMPRRRIPFQLAYIAGIVSTFLADRITRSAPQAPLEGVRLAFVPREISLETSRLQLGYAPGPVRPALANAIDWLKSHGHLSKMLEYGAADTGQRPA